MWRDGQWFNVLDEQYLLPVFSNAIASRRQANRKALRSTARLGQYAENATEDSPERDLGTTSPSGGSRTPWETTGFDSRRDSQEGTGTGNSGAVVASQRNSKGFVHHKQAPSLSIAVSSLLSSIVSSNSENQSSPGFDPEAIEAVGSVGSVGTIAHPFSASAQSQTIAKGHVPTHFFSPINPPSLPFSHIKRRDSGDSSLIAVDGAYSEPAWEDTPLAGSRATAGSSAKPSGSPPRNHRDPRVMTGRSDRGRQRHVPAPLSLTRDDPQAALYRRQSAPVNALSPIPEPRASFSAGTNSSRTNRSPSPVTGHQQQH